MKVVSVGGGPAGLYFAILIRQAFPDTEVTVLERNRPDDTFGWGVVFSDETLDGFAAADPESFAEITAGFRRWDDIETFYRGTKTVSTGHGFAAMSRKRLLQIFHQRCRDLEVELRFQHEVDEAQLDEILDEADLVLGVDGINSFIRARYEAHFVPHLDWRHCRFTWLGTDKPLDAFTFIFTESEHGLFQAHAYPFEDGLATWIVECHEDVWRRAGLDQATEEQTVAFCEVLFAEHLDGHRLLSNRSIWRAFPTVKCDTWYRCDETSSIVLLGDAAHTAHFSIGSGTKMAMEDAMVLAESFTRLGCNDIPAVLADYEKRRWVDAIKLQKAAQTSLEWFENSGRYMGQDPVQLSFNLMTRSKRITYENLKERDPALVGRVDGWFRAQINAEATRPDDPDTGATPPPAFMPMRLREMVLANRIVMSPMCQYSAVDGLPDDWHLVHYGSRAIGGAGLIMTEMTDVSPDGRITHGCAGLYNDAQEGAWKNIVGFVHARSGAKIGIQLAHAGRKASCHLPWEPGSEDQPMAAGEGAWPTMGPSALPYGAHWPTPKAMDGDDMGRITTAFVAAAHRADAAGFDLIELHMAHGYLLSSFLSPLANRRTDDYGGSFENRIRYPLEVFHAVRAVWPVEKPMSVRISASDWMADGSGTTLEEAVAISRALHRAGCDLIDVSSGGNAPESRPEWGRMYQVPFADKIRHEAGVPVMAVGAITGADHANTVVAAGRADLAAMARPHLHDAYLTLHAAGHYGYYAQPWPAQYQLGKPQPPRPNTRRQ